MIIKLDCGLTSETQKKSEMSLRTIRKSKRLFSIQIENSDLVDHINRVGLIFYKTGN
jgi:hypothetical protein